MHGALVRSVLALAFPAVLIAQSPDSIPRDTTRAEPVGMTCITGARLDSLPLDDPASAFAQVPGVFLRGGDVGLLSGASLSLRGGSSSGPATFVDGALVRSQLTGGPLIAPALNGIASVDVLTGLGGVQLPDRQGGVISYVTPSGGDRLAARWTAHTDGLFGSPAGVGYNRFSGVLSGPVPGARGLTFFASGMVQGQSSEYLGAGAQDVPTFVTGGEDTTLLVPAGSGSGTESVVIPTYVQWSGSCASGCQGLSRPMDWRTLLQFQGKVRWAYGDGSSLSLTGLAAGLEDRTFPGTDLGDPLLFSGEHDWSRLAVVNWHHVLNGSLSFDAVMSLGTDRTISGALDPASELSTRDPSFGIELSTLAFSSMGGLRVPLSEQIIRNIRTNSGLRVPFDGQTQLSDVQVGRLNPYAMGSGNFYNAGGSAPLAFSSERQLTGRWQLGWRHGRQWISVGADAAGSDVTSYDAQSTISEESLDAWTAAPRRFGVFARDLLTLGCVVIDAGLRYDHLNPGGELSITPGFTFNDPAWSPFAATSDTAYAGSVARVFAPTRGQGFVTPLVRALASLGPTTLVEITAGEEVEAPPASAILENANSDLTFTNAGAQFGRDVSYGASRLIDLEVRQDLLERAGLDLGLYYRGHVPAYGYLIENFDDPSNPGRQLTLNVLDEGGTTHVWGFEIGGHVQMSPGARLAASYSLEKAGALGTTDLGSEARGISGVTGTVLPPEGAAGTSSTGEQAVAVSLTAAVPDGWAADGWRSALRRVALVAQLRAVSGLSYTPLVNTGTGITAPYEHSTLFASGAFTSISLPWTKYLDLRVTKGIRLSGLDWTVFADFRNLLNTQNLYGVYAETNSTTNSLFEANVTSGEYATLANEAQSNGALMPDGSISTANCGGWSGEAGPVDCVMLRRADARFGNGDGVYTRAEQTATLNAFFNLVYGSWRFYGPQRTVRIGLELGL